MYVGVDPTNLFRLSARGAAEPLVPIFHHNQMDLRGLAGLSSRVLSVLADPETRGQDALELYGVSRICERRGEMTRARKLYERSLASELPAETDRAARRSLARLAKREGDFTVARGMWEKMLGNSPGVLEAYEQLAIYLEHRAREPHRAATIVRKALADLRKADRLEHNCPCCLPHNAGSGSNADWRGSNEKPAACSWRRWRRNRDCVPRNPILHKAEEEFDAGIGWHSRKNNADHRTGENDDG